MLWKSGSMQCAFANLETGSRRLITYARIPDSQVDQDALAAALAKQKSQSGVGGTTADELNPFRRGYFTKFQSPSASASASGTASPAPG